MAGEKKKGTKDGYGAHERAMTVRIEDFKIESIVRMTETWTLLKREETYRRNRNKV